MAVLKDYIEKAYDFLHCLQDCSTAILESLNLNSGSQEELYRDSDEANEIAIIDNSD